jgi:Skp family chaperone for outer membrane proteins
MKKHLLFVLLSLTLASGAFAQVTAPAPAACIAEFKKIIAESDKIFADGIAKKTINPDEGSAYKKRDATLQKQFDILVADKKLTAAECANLVKTANTEKVAVTKLAAPK